VRGSVVTVLVAAVLALAACGEGDGEQGGAEDVAKAVEPQLRYLERSSSAVFAIDMRWEERNWEHLRDIASRGLRAYRDALEPGERLQIPPNVTGAAELAARSVGLSFDDDVKPLLDGYLVVGVVQPPTPSLPPDVEALRRKPPEDLTAAEQERIFNAQARQEDAAQPRVVGVYRTGGDGLRDVIEKVAEGQELKPLEGHDDVVTLEDELAIVGDDTIVFAEDAELADVIDAAGEPGVGFPAARIADAQKAAGMEDPFVLSTGDRTVARASVEEDSLRRAFEEVPWLAAIRSFSGGMRLDENGADLSFVVSTDPRGLTDADLPLAPAGELSIPRSDHVTGASRDQSVTTTFLSRTARALFADSDFAAAVERAERDLGVSFEDEVLRQFSCPSLSRFDPETSRFAARSCVRDPERMRELLPKLSRHLPRILTTLQRLDTQGLVGLLLVAPDAPLTPSFTALADIVVKPFRGGGDDEEELLYEVTGLREDFGELAQTGPDRVVFGLIGDAFVVASDAEEAREAAKLSGEPLPEPAASAVRMPASVLTGGGDDPTSAALDAVLEEISASASADRSALRARGRIDLRD
jgi:hypothetical protein